RRPAVHASRRWPEAGARGRTFRAVRAARRGPPKPGGRARTDRAWPVILATPTPFQAWEGLAPRRSSRLSFGFVRAPAGHQLVGEPQLVEYAADHRVEHRLDRLRPRVEGRRGRQD